MRRRVWAWPVGIVGNVLLFTRLRRRHLRRGRAGAALRPGRAPGLLHRHEHLRLVALAAAASRTRAERRPRITPRWATTRERPATVLVVRSPAVLVFQWLFSRDRCGLARAALVLLVRRLDLRRLDGRDVRDGPRLDRLLAGLDRGRPGRRAAAVHSQFYPSAILYVVYARSGRLGLRRLAAGARTAETAAAQRAACRMSEPSTGRDRASIRLDTSRARGRRHRGRQGRRRRRRRGPRERGRPDLRGRQGHAGAAGVHDPAHAAGWSACRWRPTCSTGSSSR